MEESGLDGLDPATRRALYRRALVRPLLTMTALVALYYLLPLDRWHEPMTVFAIAGGLLAVVGLGALQVRAILRARYPAVQAVEALAVAVPLFLLLFAAGYSLMSARARARSPSRWTGPTPSTSPSPCSPRWASATSRRSRSRPGSSSLCRWWAICWFSAYSFKRSWERSSSVVPGGGMLRQTDHLTQSGWRPIRSAG